MESAPNTPAEPAGPPDVGPPDAELDITADLCPMTFVRTRIALDRLPVGALLRVRMRGEEPSRNVPRTAQQQGHEVVSMEDGPDGTCVLLLRKHARRK